MTKLVPVSIAGKAWIQLSQLNAEQAKSLKNWLPNHLPQTLTFQGITLNDLVDFAAYEYWFRNHQMTRGTLLLQDF